MDKIVGTDVTIGYWYRMGAHLALCHGPIHAVTRMKMGDKIMWAGPPGGITSNQRIYINQPYLFGGEDREGGFDGNVDILLGGGAQEVNAYLASVLPEADPMPAFRHIASIVLAKPRVTANNPNVRPINVEVFYQPAKDWYPETEQPLHDMSVNPAHMIRDCLTHPVWGLGYSTLELNDASFRAAALQLYNEGFGLSLIWDKQSTLQDFIGTIVSHIDAVVYVNPFDGLFTIKLLRDDYDVNTIPLFDESNTVSLDSFERLSVGELANQVILIWYDDYLDMQRSVTVHNMVTRELQGGVVSSSIEFPGIGNSALANTVATRELRKASTAFSRITIQTNREGANIGLGGVFKFTRAEYGIVNVVYRVARIVYDSQDSTKITIYAVEDIYSLGASVYANPPESHWKDPVSEPAPAPKHQANEVPYLLVDRAMGEIQTFIDALDPMAGFIAYQASSPSQDAFNYKLYTRASGGTFTQKGAGMYTPTAVVLQPLAPEVTSTFAINPDVDLSSVALNSYAIIEDELVAVTALSASSITVNRGILDTVPTYHGTGATIWFADRRQAFDTTEWANGVVVQAKATPITGKGPLDLSLAPVDTVTIKRRWQRPYPPGNVKLNGSRWPTDTTVGEPVFTWSHRDRLTQLSYYVNQSEGNFGPEAGVTYTARVYTMEGVLKRTVTGITGTTWTYTSADETADNPGDFYMVTISAVRDGLESWQAQQVLVFRLGIGYGYTYGDYYGGWSFSLGYGNNYGQFYGRFTI